MDYLSTPIWTPIPYFNGRFFYSVASVEAGFHIIYSAGNCTVFISGSKNGVGYGYVAAYNSKFAFSPNLLAYGLLSVFSEPDSMKHCLVC